MISIFTSFLPYSFQPLCSLVQAMLGLVGGPGSVRDRCTRAWEPRAMTSRTYPPPLLCSPKHRDSEVALRGRVVGQVTWVSGSTGASQGREAGLGTNRGRSLHPQRWQVLELSQEKHCGRTIQSGQNLTYVYGPFVPWF